MTLLAHLQICWRGGLVAIALAMLIPAVARAEIVLLAPNGPGEAGADLHDRLREGLARLGTAGGGLLIVPPGDYTLAPDKVMAGPLVLPGNTTLRCEPGTKITLARVGRCPGGLFSSGEVQNVFIEGGEWEASMQGCPVFWHANGTRRFGLCGATIRTFSVALQDRASRRCQDLRFQDNRVIQCRNSGLSCTRVDGALVARNVFMGTGLPLYQYGNEACIHGVYFGAVRGGTLYLNRCVDNLAFGIHVHSGVEGEAAGGPARELTLHHNWTSGNGLGGIYAGGKVLNRRIAILDNRCSEPEGSGVILKSTRQGLVAWNAVADFRKAGIVVGFELATHSEYAAEAVDLECLVHGNRLGRTASRPEWGTCVKRSNAGTGGMTFSDNLDNQPALPAADWEALLPPCLTLEPGWRLARPAGWPALPPRW
jgi:hypothetical protein